MRVLFTSLSGTGHFLPLVPFIAACRERGHEVGVSAPPDLAEHVASAGARFFPFALPSDEELHAIELRLRGTAPEDMNGVVIREMFAGVFAKAALPQLIATVEQWQPSIVVRESQEYSSVLATEKLGVARARVSIMMRSFEGSMVAHAAPAVDAHRQEIGLSSDPTGERMLREPALSHFPASFDSVEDELATVKRFRAVRKPAQALPAWWSDQRPPLVYVTLGTVMGRRDEDVAAYKRVIEAASALPIRVLLTIGKQLATEALGELPANVHLERFVPQDDVLPHAAAVLCHGGSGTVVGTLAAGVPMVVSPVFADQPDNAARVQAIGAGLALPTREVSVEDTRRALARVLDEPGFRSAAERVAAEIAALPPVNEAAAELERLVHAHAR